MKTNQTCLPILILLFSVGFSFAQTSGKCSTDDHRGFDFWIGEWTVYNTKNKVVGTNKVVSMQDGCVLQENWVASNKTNTGTSYNFYNTKNDTWNQVWISNTGNVLELKGNVSDEGNMVLKSDLTESPRGKFYNQITWSKNDDGSITQKWVILNEKGEIINVAFEGIYRKK